MARAMEWQECEAESYGALSDREQLLLDILRRWLTGWETKDPHHWQIAWQLLCRRCPAPTARRVLGQTEQFVRAIAADAIRGLSFHRPCCARVSADERLLLDMMVAPRRPSLFAAAARVLDPAAVDPVLTLGARVNHALECGLAAGSNDPSRRAASLAEGSISQLIH